MKQEEKLKEIIEKAVKGGYSHQFYNYVYEGTGCYTLLLAPLEDEETDFISGGINDILFSHDFAKAFWGEEKHTYFQSEDAIDNSDFEDWAHCKCFSSIQDGIKTDDTTHCWQYHLQQAVISYDPIEYYYKFI